MNAVARGAHVVRRDLALLSDEVPRPCVRLVTLDASTGATRVAMLRDLPTLLRAGDLLVVNDAATMPASLRGRTRGGAPVELRLAQPVDGVRLIGVLFGAGDHRTRTEDRPAPPVVRVGDELVLGEVVGRVTAVDGRRVEMRAATSGDALWQALYASGAVVQYAHRREPMALWDVQTAYATRPWSAEMPSAGRGLTWEVLLGLRRAGIAVATLSHAAGLSSTGDAALDAALPWPERYEIPEATARAVADAGRRGARVIAVGTTVVRALEASGGRAGQGTATGRIDATTRLGNIDGLISGLHVPGESHFELLQAFASRTHLERALEAAAERGMSAHELGDACLILRG